MVKTLKIHINCRERKAKCLLLVGLHLKPLEELRNIENKMRALQSRL